MDGNRAQVNDYTCGCGGKGTKLIKILTRQVRSYINMECNDHIYFYKQHSCENSKTSRQLTFSHRYTVIS